MTTQTISGAAILMREYIKLWMKVGSTLGIGHWRYTVSYIDETNGIVQVDGNPVSHLISEYNLIIEPDEMPFEGTVPDGWELSWGGQMWRIELIYSSEVLKKAWFSYANQDFVADFSLLTLKRKPCSPNNK